MNKSAQKGVAHILLLVAALGVVAFILVSSTVPFKDRVFGELYQKPISQAAVPNGIDMAYPCGFTNPAFCDDFSQGPAPVKGRGNDLDFRTWSFNRVGGESNGMSALNAWPTIPVVEHCLTRPTDVNAPLDSFFCGSEVPEAEHWMEAINGGGYLANDARIRQPFDFTNRTGLIQYGVDAKTAGSHSWWLETWITDTPQPGVHEETGSGFRDVPRNGIGLRFDVTCDVARPANYFEQGAGAVGIPNALVMSNYQIVREYPNELGGNRVCVRTQGDRSNMIQIRLSTTRVEVFSSDAGSNVIRRIFAANIDPPLPFSVGYVHFAHVQYGPEKADVRIFQTYHWHDMGFDGPIHSTPRAYEIPDSLTRTSAVGLNTGYGVRPDGTLTDGVRNFPAFTLQNVDLSGAASARVNLNVDDFYPSGRFFYRLNDGPERNYPYPGPSQYLHWGSVSEPAPEQMGLSIPITLSDLRSGNNTLRFRMEGRGVVNGGSNTTRLNNIELEIVPPDSSTPAPAAGMVPCRQFQLLMVMMPGMLMGDDPCSGPGPSMTPMPTATPGPTSGPTSTPTPGPGATATPRPTATPTPTSTPAPVPGTAQTITFNDRTLQSRLGEYPLGVINWGNNWFVARPTNQFTTPNLHMGSVFDTSRSFSFLTPQRLLRVDMVNHGSTPSTVSFACSGNPTAATIVPAAGTAVLTTAWTTPCTTVTVTSSNGWVVHYDNLVIQ